MLVSDILSKKGTVVLTITCDETVGNAAAILAEKKYGVLVISSNGSAIEGIISERDIVRGLAERGGELLGDPVSTVMTSEVYTCESGDTVESLMSRMTDKRIRHLPVSTGGVLSGLISIGDVVKARVSELEEEARHLGNYIQGY